MLFVLRTCCLVRRSDVGISLQRLHRCTPLAATNALARGSLKDAANCVTHLELQISEKEKDSERIPRVGLAQFTWLAVTAISSRSGCSNLTLRLVSWPCAAPTRPWNSAYPLCPCTRRRCASRVSGVDWVIRSVWTAKFDFVARSRPITGLPAEFKHINKWRSINYPGFPQ